MYNFVHGIFPFLYIPIFLFLYILIVSLTSTNMERAWLNRSDQNKKPENLKLDYKINCCVIKFEIEKNKKLLTDE